MSSESFTSCLCKTTIPASHPYCLQNKSCLEFIVEGSTYLFDDSVKKAEIETFVKLLPITLNKRIIKKEVVDINDFGDSIKEKLLQSPTTPIDFLIPTVIKNFPATIVELQKNEKMLSLGKEIRKRNFSKKLIEKLDRLSIYFAIFFYESRNHPIWRTVLDSVIKAPFTPQQLLKTLDTLFRKNASEYLKFYATLCQNTSLTRIIYLIESMKDDEQENEGLEKTEQEEIMSISKLNHYAHHWFPGIVLTACKHPALYKTTLEKVYEELYAWKDLYQPENLPEKLYMYDYKPENPQTINPQHLEVLTALLQHSKVPSRILLKEVENPDDHVRKTIVLSANVTATVLTKLQEDTNEYIRKIALFKLVILKKEKRIQKTLQEDENTPSDETVRISPENVQDQFKDTTTIFHL